MVVSQQIQTEFLTTVENLEISKNIRPVSSS